MESHDGSAACTNLNLLCDGRRPSRYTHLIRWRTDTDELTAGQWIKGKVSSLTLTGDGRQMAAGIAAGTQCAIIAKLPHFTALEVWIGGLCMANVAFDKDDRMARGHGREHIVHVHGKCASRRSHRLDVPYYHDYVIRDGGEAADRQGRRVRFLEG